MTKKDLRAQCNNEYLPTHDFHIGQSVMYLNPVNRRWYPATITSLFQEPQSYKIETDDGTIYRKTQEPPESVSKEHRENKHQ